MSHSSLVLWPMLLYVTGESNRDADVSELESKSGFPKVTSLTTHTDRLISKPAGLGSTMEEPPEDPRGQLVQIN